MAYITNVVVKRTNATGELTNAGTYFGITCDCRRDNVNQELKVSWRDTDTPSWSSVLVTDCFNTNVGQPILLTGSLYRMPLTGGISTNKIYEVKISLFYYQDLGEIVLEEKLVMLPGDSFPIDILKGGGGVAIGKQATNTGFDVAMPAHFSYGATQDIPYYEAGNCNSFVTTGSAYLGSDVLNKPDGMEGLLTTRYSLHGVCYQEFITIVNRWYRIGNIGDSGCAWGVWAQDISPQYSVDDITAIKNKADSAYDDKPSYYVVSHWGDSDWTVRTWNNRWTECWGELSFGSLSCDSSFGSGLYRTAAITCRDYPVTFTGTPYLQYSYRNATDIGGFLWPLGTPTNIHPPSFYVVRPNTSVATVAGQIHLYAAWYS